jgi:hypothetical protein
MAADLGVAREALMAHYQSNHVAYVKCSKGW